MPLVTQNIDCGTYPLSLGNPNTILVHGAVLPLPDTLHTTERPNNCFFQLGSFLYSDCRHNVWSFEYADERVGELPGYVNYGCLNTYGDRLMEAIQLVESRNQNGAVNIIAHSRGGLVARYAAKICQLEQSLRLSHWIPDISDLISPAS
jgi:hypothetical protein